MRIGELARLTGTSPKGIRLYEARGLLGQVQREGAYRRYSADDVARVQLIRQAQALGFRLAELDGLDAMHTPQGWARMAALVRERRLAVAAEQQRLHGLAAQLAALEDELMACDVAQAAPAPLECLPLPEKVTT